MKRLRGRQVGSRRLAALGFVALAGCYQGLAGGQAPGGDGTSDGGDGGGDSEGPPGVDDDGDEDDGDGDDGDGDDGVAECDPTTLGLAPMRRLTDVQLRNTIDDLFDGAIDSPSGLPPTAPGEGYSNDPDRNVVSLLAADQLRMTADEIAEQVLADVDAVAPCEGASESECATTFIEATSRRAFRRPPTASELDRLEAVYDAVAVDAGYDVAIAATTSAILQMPQFLYLVEVGEPVEGSPGLLALTDHEIAARLSYLLWDSMPDDALMQAADAGALSSPDGIEAEARRMLASPRSTGALLRFYAEWLTDPELEASDKDGDAFPDFDADLVDAMRRELRFAVERLHADGGESLSALFTSRQTMVNPALAAHYGVAGVEDLGDEWTATTLPEDQRAGVLTMAVVLAGASAESTTSTIRRGELVREGVLCQELPPPPPDAMATVEFPPGATEREKWAILQQAECGGCHVMMNPIGLGFEHFDATGRWRDADAEGPIDASGSLAGFPEPDFEGAVELAERLAGEAAVGDCYVDQLIRYTWGRHHATEDACTVAAIREALQDADYRLNDAIVALARSTAFSHRRLED